MKKPRALTPWMLLFSPSASSPCNKTCSWRGKTACFISTPLSCHTAIETCQSHSMQLFTINDDFDLMLIFYFTTRKIRDARAEFWLRIYDMKSDECSVLVNNHGSFSVVAESGDENLKYFLCEFFE